MKQTSIEDDLNGRRPTQNCTEIVLNLLNIDITKLNTAHKWKWTSMEDNLNGR